MYDLTLRPGPELIYGFPERVDGKLAHVTGDVTAKVEGFLFHVLRIREGVTLGHVLRLFELCPGLETPMLS